MWVYRAPSLKLIIARSQTLRAHRKGLQFYKQLTELGQTLYAMQRPLFRSDVRNGTSLQDRQSQQRLSAMQPRHPPADTNLLFRHHPLKSSEGIVVEQRTTPNAPLSNVSHLSPNTSFDCTRPLANTLFKPRFDEMWHLCLNRISDILYIVCVRTWAFHPSGLLCCT
jgi:hypothetical protein